MNQRLRKLLLLNKIFVKKVFCLVMANIKQKQKQLPYNPECLASWLTICTQNSTHLSMNSYFDWQSCAEGGDTLLPAAVHELGGTQRNRGRAASYSQGA